MGSIAKGYGWDGSAWRKLPLVWGYSDVYNELESEVDVAAGDRTLTFSAVPSGEVWVISHIAAFCTTSNPSGVQFQPIIGGAYCVISHQAYPTANLTVEVRGPLYLKYQSAITIKFLDCILNDDIYAYACGYKMKVGE